MKLYELLDAVDFQSEIGVVYFDWKNFERVEVFDMKKYRGNSIKFVYSENDILYIEIEVEDEE